jgi:hypothetical protein
VQPLTLGRREQLPHLGVADATRQVIDWFGFLIRIKA